MNLFETDLFTVTSLTAAINEQEYVPRRLGELGWFQAEGLTTTSMVIEKSGGQLQLVPTKERGAPGTVFAGDKRHGVTFSALHLPTRATLLADETQNVRAFGTENQLQAIETLRNQRLTKMARSIDVTHEYHRIGAIKGKILDADGITVLVDLYSAFGIEQKTINFALGTASTDVQMKCLDVLEAIEEGMGETIFAGAHALCGKSFWRKLISHSSVKETYRYQMSQRLRDDARESFEFGGIVWERYRGTVKGQAFVEDTAAYVEPTGTVDKLITRFAPGDYLETVNTVGLPLYSSAEPLPHNKGIDLEAQSNPIHLNTRPGATIKLVESGS
ncbi:major capsid protein [Salinicola acroporae]|uniref:Major capsid protein E n=1 Tax=Salinicola acroporae TaxID=1541440 RepID=A0ABT6I5B6_9GAMM|nr:major capsid protein [Salinicola acroporae]MDH4572465.1 major capsid protein E [Salinicola acroporae]